MRREDWNPAQRAMEYHDAVFRAQVRRQRMLEQQPKQLERIAAAAGSALLEQPESIGVDELI